MAAKGSPEDPPVILERAGLKGCGRPEPSSPVSSRPPNNPNETPPGQGLSKPLGSVGGPISEDPAQPISNQGGNGGTGERPKEKTTGWGLERRGKMVPAVGTPKGSLVPSLEE